MTSIRKPYTTKTRTEILEFLKEHASSTVSVADIQNYLKEKRAETNTTTIYRFLDKLCREHIVIKYPDAEKDKAVYQYAGLRFHG